MMTNVRHSHFWRAAPLGVGAGHADLIRKVHVEVLRCTSVMRLRIKHVCNFKIC